MALLRLGWRATHRVEAPAHVGLRWEQVLASGVQAALSVCLLAMPLLGWVASALSGDIIRAFGITLPDVLTMYEDSSDTLFEVHSVLAWVLLALVAPHVSGALRHHFILRDGALDRMRIG